MTALRAAADLARLANASLHILHVIEAHPRAASWFGGDGQGAAQSIEQKATTAMEALVARWAKALEAIPVTTEITTGLAFVELMNRVHDSTRVVIVIGAKGVTLLEDAFFGSTAERVVKGAPCSVLVVRDQAGAGG